MRILGEITGYPCKITVFQMDDKLSVKFEKDLLEQTFKYRSSAVLSTMQDVRTLVTKEFVAQVFDAFDTMKVLRDGALSVLAEKLTSDEFDEII